MKLVLAACLLASTPAFIAAASIYDDWSAAHLSGAPAQAGPLDDPDGDRRSNLLEFALGTDPLSGNVHGSPLLMQTDAGGGVITVEVLQREGAVSCAQLDLELSGDMADWFRPWWWRQEVELQAGDPPGALRESFTTVMPPAAKWYVRGTVTLLERGPETPAAPAGAKVYYIAPGGSDSNAGTFASPYATLAKATNKANPGDLIYLRGGTYNCTARIYISRSGSAQYPIRVRAYPGEHPVLDFSAMTETNLYGISIAGSYWNLRGIEVFNAPGSGIRMVGHATINPAGSYNIIERCTARNCRQTGISIGGTTTPYLPGHNLVLNCDAIRCYDAAGHGEDADGMGAKFYYGPGNVFRGCRAWENSDDGWDMWTGNEPVLFENCWAFGNGQNLWGDTAFTGNGNGFKLGGRTTGTPDIYTAAHRVVRCLSFNNSGNSGWGIDQNNNAAALTIDHCTVWGNKTGAIQLNHSTTKTEAHIVRNNLVIGGTVAFTTATTLTGNSWQVLSPAANAADFLEMITGTDEASIAAVMAYLTAPRREDGGLPEFPLARPDPEGRLVDAGANFSDGGYLGYTNAFNGAAPDLGAFETPVW